MVSRSDLKVVCLFLYTVGGYPRKGDNFELSEVNDMVASEGARLDIEMNASLYGIKISAAKVWNCFPPKCEKSQ